MVVVMVLVVVSSSGAISLLERSLDRRGGGCGSGGGGGGGGGVCVSDGRLNDPSLRPDDAAGGRLTPPCVSPCLLLSSSSPFLVSSSQLCQFHIVLFPYSWSIFGCCFSPRLSSLSLSFSRYTFISFWLYLSRSSPLSHCSQIQFSLFLALAPALAFSLALTLSLSLSLSL